MSTPVLFPARISIGEFSTAIGGRKQIIKVQMTPEFYRALQATLQRLGGPASDIPGVSETYLDITMAPYMGQSEDTQPFITVSAPQQTFDPPVFQPQRDGSPLPTRSVTVTASPMTIRADRPCAIHINGAATLTYSRAGVNLTVTGNLIEMSLGDTLTVTYTSAPTLTLIPR